MGVDIAAPTVVGGQMKDDLHPLCRSVGNVAIEQVLLPKLDPPGFDVSSDVVQKAAAEIVDDPYARALRDERIHQVRADERGPAGDQHAPTLPFVVHC